VSALTRYGDWDFNFQPSALAAVPTDIFDTEKSLKLNGSTLQLKYYGPAHTDCDISVNFSEADILHVGDTFWNAIYPFIDYSTGGSIGGMIKATEANLHGAPVSNRKDLSSYRDMLVTIHDNVTRLKQRGSSIEETVSAKPTAAYDAKWGQFVITPEFFVRLFYQGV